MAEKLTIKFSAVGGGALKKTLEDLHLANVKLTKGQKAFIRAQKLATREQSRYNKVGMLGVKNMRIQAGAFATLRSKLLLFSFAIGLVTMAMRKLFDAFTEQERVEKKLEVALGSVNHALLNQASALQSVTTFGDEAIINVQALIGSFTDDEEAIKAATKATLDLAAAKGMDLKAAGDLVSKTLGSSTNSLSRYGVEVEGAVGSTKRLESLTTNIADLFGGQATAAADTLGGSLSQMANAAGDASEAFGKAFAPQMKKIAKFLKVAADESKEFFLSFSETGLERTIRKLEEAGESTDGLRLTLLGIQKDAAFEELGIELDNIGALDQDIIDLSKTLVNQQAVLVKSLEKQGSEYERLVDLGYSLEEIEKELNVTIGEHYKAILNLNKAQDPFMKKKKKQLDDEVDILNTSLKNEKLSEEEIAQITERLAKLTEIKVIIEKINAIALKGIDDQKTSFGEMFQTFMTENKETIDGSIEIAKGFNNILKELAAEARAEAQAQIDVMNEIASAEISALRETTKAEMDLHKKSRAFKRLSVKAQAAYEKNEMEKLAKAEAKINAEKEAKNAAIREQANKDIVRQFKFGQALNIAEAVMNTANSIMKVTAQTGIVAAPWIAAYTALGAAQVALIASQKPPTMAQGGLIGGRPHSQGGTMINAERGEFVMSRSAVDSIGTETLNRLNQGGATSNIVINFSGNVLSQDYIEDEAIPQIKEALRRGGDIGVG